MISASDPKRTLFYIFCNRARPLVKMVDWEGDRAALASTVEELRRLVLEQKQQLEQQSLFIDQLVEQIRLARHQHSWRQKRALLDRPDDTGL